MFQKPLEYWAVLIGMVLYAASRDAESQPLAKRLVKVGASAFLALGLSPSLAPWVSGSESIATVLIMAVGLVALDVLVALVADREFIKDLIRRRLGGGGGDGNA